MRRFFSALLSTAVILALAGTVAIAGRREAKEKKSEEERPPAVVVEHWLVLGPVEHRLPVFHDEKRGGFDLKKLLAETRLPDLRHAPRDGEVLAWFGDESIAWTTQEAGKRGSVELKPAEEPEEGSPAVAWAAAYVETERWQELELELRGEHPRRAWIDGEPVASGDTAGEAEVKANVQLTSGKHLLLVQTVLDPAHDGEWGLGAALRVPEGEAPPEIVVSLEPARNLKLSDILDPPSISSLAVSPDGTHVVTSVQRTVPGTHASESWIEIRATADGSLRESWRGGVGASQVGWSPDGRFISYLTTSAGGVDSGGSLYLYERSAGRVRPLLEDVAHLADYLWSPTGKAIVYRTTVEAEKDERGVKRLEGLLDREATYRNKQVVHLVTVPGGARRQLTAGGLTTSALAISPDGRRLLFTRRIEQLERRPYSRTELWELDLESFAARKLRDFAWLNSATYAPDGRRILIGSQSQEFGDEGVNVPAGVVPNSYDGQLFVWDPESSEVDAITREFDPAVNGVVWSRHDGRIYLAATERDLGQLYRYDPDSRQFTALDTGFEVFSGFELADAAPVAVGLGTSAWKPQRLVAVDLETARAREIEHPADAWFADVNMGDVEPWTFSMPGGRTIDGRIYLPPGFDPERKYPAIVYYYGGTSPVSRRFGGRYPKEWWTSNGYVVYVLQPSGATGFGQEFSATHVNDWGKTTSEEIIVGTKRFLESHSYVDPERVGCIGASYGGFMTMLLSTQTDIFAAAVSHAGISSISSYWGEGYWGYSYSSVASADSFPWDRRDIYVDQSPLFRADRNRVPILLTHGSADTNVPVGESDAFYIALKLLGKDVEYIRIEGQDHWILDHQKRQVWSSSILAWFDRRLKGQPEWWNHLYPSDATAD